MIIRKPLLYLYAEVITALRLVVVKKSGISQVVPTIVSYSSDKRRSGIPPGTRHVNDLAPLLCATTPRLCFVEHTQFVAPYRSRRLRHYYGNATRDQHASAQPRGAICPPFTIVAPELNSLHYEPYEPPHLSPSAAGTQVTRMTNQHP